MYFFAPTTLFFFIINRTLVVSEIIITKFTRCIVANLKADAKTTLSDYFEIANLQKIRLSHVLRGGNNARKMNELVQR